MAFNVHMTEVISSCYIVMIYIHLEHLRVFSHVNHNNTIVESHFGTPWHLFCYVNVWSFIKVYQCCYSYFRCVFIWRKTCLSSHQVPAVCYILYIACSSIFRHWRLPSVPMGKLNLSILARNYIYYQCPNISSYSFYTSLNAIWMAQLFCVETFSASVFYLVEISLEKTLSIAIFYPVHSESKRYGVLILLSSDHQELLFFPNN